jgi:hypothetical protein
MTQTADVCLLYCRHVTHELILKTNSTGRCSVRENNGLESRTALQFNSQHVTITGVVSSTAFAELGIWEYYMASPKPLTLNHKTN